MDKKLSREIIDRLRFSAPIDGDGWSWESYEDPKTGNVYEIPIEIVRHFDDYTLVTEKK
tara:strand:- start:4019 stop:4195 length:177 start_codon:yes stop_codon:yes gene_type:complete